MKNKAVLREFLRYASSNILAMLGLSCFILVDTFFIAQGMGKNGMAALNLSIPVYSLIYGSSHMLGQGPPPAIPSSGSRMQRRKASRPSAGPSSWAELALFC